MENTDQLSGGTYSDRHNRPRSASLQSDNRPWQVPTFQLTTTASQTSQHSFFPPSPTIPVHPHLPIPDPARNNTNFETQSIAPSLASSDDDEESAYDEDIEEGIDDADESTLSHEKERDRIFELGRRMTRQKTKPALFVDTDPLNDNHNIRRFSKPPTSAEKEVFKDTLVEAAMDQQEAKDRHVRFTDHLTEAGNLVQNMLNSGMNSPNVGGISPVHSNHASDRRHIQSPIQEDEEGSIPMQKFPSNQGSYQGAVGGSVLASLMKLEAQRRSSIAQHDRKKKAGKKKKKVIN
jgi:hypothetical protein